MTPVSDPEATFLAALPSIDAITAAVARRHRLPREDAEEFRSIVRLRLVDNDYAVLRQFRGSSSLHTFLNVVISRQCLDFCSASWGRWRVSAKARRMGPAATALERLIQRDGMPFETAALKVQAMHPEMTLTALRSMADALPPRVKRQRVHEDRLDEMCAPGTDPDAALMRRQGPAVDSTLARVMSVLDAADQRLLRLRFVDGLSIVRIAREDGVDAAALYRRVERILRGVRRSLEKLGIDRAGVRAHLLWRS